MMEIMEVILIILFIVIILFIATIVFLIILLLLTGSFLDQEEKIFEDKVDEAVKEEDIMGLRDTLKDISS